MPFYIVHPSPVCGQNGKVQKTENLKVIWILVLACQYFSDLFLNFRAIFFRCVWGDINFGGGGNLNFSHSFSFHFSYSLFNLNKTYYFILNVCSKFLNGKITFQYF